MLNGSSIHFMRENWYIRITNPMGSISCAKLIFHNILCAYLNDFVIKFFSFTINPRLLKVCFVTHLLKGVVTTPLRFVQFWCKCWVCFSPFLIFPLTPRTALHFMSQWRFNAARVTKKSILLSQNILKLCDFHEVFLLLLLFLFCLFVCLFFAT